MQGINVYDNKCMKHIQVNQYSDDEKLDWLKDEAANYNQSHDPSILADNYLEVLEKTQHLVNGLQRSFNKTKKYEKRLFQCKSTHEHSHFSDTSSKKNLSEENNSEYKSITITDTPKVSRTTLGVSDSWSTMSMVCLQYKYEELSSRYESLLKAHDEKCRALENCESELAELRQRDCDAQMQLAETHTTLLDMGEKCINLQRKNREQKKMYEDKIKRMKNMIKTMSRMAESDNTDVNLSEANQEDSVVSMASLQAEVRKKAKIHLRKCNRLCFENMMLRNKMEDLIAEYKFD